MTDEGDKPPFLLYLLCACALVASVLMLFSSNTLWMKIAVLFALWAAFLGALATTRLRKQVASHRERMRDSEALHQAALDREIASHREQERRLEQNYYQALQRQEQTLLEEIRAQLESLRENLEAMMGQDLEERQALRAQAQRIVELEDSVGRRAAGQGHSVPVAEPLVEPDATAPASQPEPEPEPEPLPEDSGDPYAYLSTWGASADAAVTYIGTDTEKSDYFVFDTAAFGPESHSKHAKQDSDQDQPQPEAPAEMTVKARKASPAQPQQRFSWAASAAADAPAENTTEQPHGHHEKPERVANPATGSFAAFRPSTYSTPQGPAGTFNAGNYETSTDDVDWARHRPVENTAGRRRADDAKQSTVTVASLLENLKKNSGPQQ